MVAKNCVSWTKCAHKQFRVDFHGYFIFFSSFSFIIPFWVYSFFFSFLRSLVHSLASQSPFNLWICIHFIIWLRNILKHMFWILNEKKMKIWILYLICECDARRKETAIDIWINGDGGIPNATEIDTSEDSITWQHETAILA